MREYCKSDIGSISVVIEISLENMELRAASANGLLVGDAPVAFSGYNVFLGFEQLLLCNYGLFTCCCYRYDVDEFFRY